VNAAFKVRSEAGSSPRSTVPRFGRRRGNAALRVVERLWRPVAVVAGHPIPELPGRSSHTDARTASRRGSCACGPTAAVIASPSAPSSTAGPRRERRSSSRICWKIQAGIWEPPAAQSPDRKGQTFHEFATSWLTRRKPSFKERTYEQYRYMLTNHLLPRFARLRLSQAARRGWV